ncbi:MAG: ThiF family adenylyltransferase [Lachnospiraceae bacterium]|nr:ThiF family adenylyltransferase [Lachnospiraceae bacterium]
MLRALTDAQIERYSRHIILKEVGAKGQKKLLNAKVLIIGAGGLGAPAAMYLGAAGVGTIGIVDADEVDLSNLQRQIIHATEDVGKPKVTSARETIEKMNPDVKVNTYHMMTKIYDRSLFKAGDEIVGPAIINQMDTTIVIEPDCIAHVNDYGVIVVDIHEPDEN